MSQKTNITMLGHIFARYKDTGEIIINKKNAVHPQNMATVIARGLAHASNGQIFALALGNGGTHIDSSGDIVYLPPNTTGTTATLYNQTYSEIVDSQSVNVGSGNSVTAGASPAPAVTSIVTVNMEIAPDEPSGQSTSDNTTTNPNSTYTFDEMGLLSADSTPLLLTHSIFNPIEKTSNRSILITYTLTISVS